MLKQYGPKNLAPRVCREIEWMQPAAPSASLHTATATLTYALPQARSL